MCLPQSPNDIKTLQIKYITFFIAFKLLLCTLEIIFDQRKYFYMENSVRCMNHTNARTIFHRHVIDIEEILLFQHCVSSRIHNIEQERVPQHTFSISFFHLQTHPNGFLKRKIAIFFCQVVI